MPSAPKSDSMGILYRRPMIFTRTVENDKTKTPEIKPFPPVFLSLVSVLFALSIFITFHRHFINLTSIYYIPIKLTL
jgi:hypothetical protein